MTTQEQKNLILENMVETLELPELAYEKAKKRYEDLGEWFGRDESLLKDNDPHIFPQGSFRLGTAIKPLDKSEEYDLDLACNLRKGITQITHTQYNLKNIVGDELKAYREARSIQSDVEEKHRCWRLEYQDELSFHMDIVPCIPSSEIQMDSLFESMTAHEIDTTLARPISELAISITDDRNDNYTYISDDWNISNPEGYATWFEYNMNQGHDTVTLEHAQVDDVPNFQYKTTLQRVVQLLKRHRDSMFKDNEDSKPISIIITTLAAKAYNGETDLELAITNVLLNMHRYIKDSTPRIANPVNNDEDFADRWAMPAYIKLDLEANFRTWLKQANVDFQTILSSDDSNFRSKQIQDKFSLSLKTAPAIITGTTNIAHTSGRQA
jgi:hypothetical protein